MSRRRAPRHVLTTLVAVVALVALATGVAVAFWRSSGAGAGTASTASLHAPTSVLASSTVGTGVVSVSWTAPVGSPAPTGYYVLRLNSANNSFAACGTSASSTITTTTCNDTAVPVGTYTYEAVAADHSWTANSVPSAAVTVAKANQNITITSSAPSNAVFNGPTYTVTATGGASGNAVAFTIDASATSVCSISGSVVSFVGVGACVIDANQAGSTYYNAAPQTQQSFAVAQASQAITFTSTTPTNATVGGAGYTPTATGGASGNPVTFTIDATTATKCSISGGVVTFQHVGSCTVDANQAGNANYSAALQVQQSFAVGKGAQAITYTTTAPSSATVNGATYTVTATGGGSSNPVTFSIDATASSVCTISGAVVSFVAGGTCVIDANQAANTDYLAASQVQQSFAVAKATQTISYTSSAPSGATVGGATYTPTASSTSGLGVTITVDSGSSSVCSISAGVVSFTAAGTCTLDANQAGNASYLGAPQAQQSFTVYSPVTITSLALANTSGVTAGRMDAGDTVTIGFSAPLAVSSVCSAWAGNASNQTSSTATVHVTGNGTSANNVLSISAWTGCATFHVGSIDLGSKNYVTSTGTSNKPVDFTGSTVAYNATSHTITITLGAPATGGGNGALGTVSSSAATLTVDSGVTGTSGQSVIPPTFATGNVKQF